MWPGPWRLAGVVLAEQYIPKVRDTSPPTRARKLPGTFCCCLSLTFALYCLTLVGVYFFDVAAINRLAYALNAKPQAVRFRS